MSLQVFNYIYSGLCLILASLLLDAYLSPIFEWGIGAVCIYFLSALVLSPRSRLHFYPFFVYWLAGIGLSVLFLLAWGGIGPPLWPSFLILFLLLLAHIGTGNTANPNARYEAQAIALLALFWALFFFLVTLSDMFAKGNGLLFYCMFGFGSISILLAHLYFSEVILLRKVYLIHLAQVAIFFVLVGLRYLEVSQPNWYLVVLPLVSICFLQATLYKSGLMYRV